MSLSIQLSYSQGSGIIKIENGKFTINGFPFYPKVCNYPLGLYSEDGGTTMFLTPFYAYLNPDEVCDPPSKVCYDEIIKKHLEGISALGFNCIRTLGGPFRLVMDSEKKNLCMDYISNFPLGTWDYHAKKIIDERKYQIPISYLEDFLALAQEQGLYVIVEASASDYPDVKYKYKTFLGQFARTHANDPRILAFDIMNEPNSYSTIPGTHDPTLFSTRKPEVDSVIDLWYQSIKSESSNLVTIGAYCSPYDCWDPGVMNVDFISLHQYPIMDKLQDYLVRENVWKNNLFWYYTSVDKPWMIGETGFSANDAAANQTMTWGTEQNQRSFGDLSQRYVKSLNGIGYSWYDYLDVYNPDINNPTIPKCYFGVVKADKSYKPVADVFDEHVIYKKDHGMLNEPPYYYHVPSYNPDFYVTGTVVGINDNLPIENAMVIGWYIRAGNVTGSNKSMQTEDAMMIGHYKRDNTINEPVDEIVTIGPIFTDHNGYFKLEGLGPITDIWVSQSRSCVKHKKISNNIENVNITLTCDGKRPIINLTYLDNKYLGSPPYFSPPTSFLTLNDDFLVEGDGTNGVEAYFKATKQITIFNSTIEKGANVTIVTGPIISNCWYDPCPPSTEPENFLSTNVPIIFEQKGIQVTPNPNNGNFTIEFENNNNEKELWIMDILGNIKFHTRSFESKIDIVLDNCTPATYLVKVQENNIIRFTKIIVIK